MIQRIQTVWLILAAAAVFLTLKLPTLVIGNEIQFITGMDDFLIMVLSSVLGTGIVVNIFLFRKRLLQLRICVVAILIEIGIIALYWWKLKRFDSGTFGIWAILHLVAIIALILAARGINKDEKLIKESNRLR